MKPVNNSCVCIYTRYSSTRINPNGKTKIFILRARIDYFKMKFKNEFIDLVKF